MNKSPKSLTNRIFFPIFFMKMTLWGTSFAIGKVCRLFRVREVSTEVAVITLFSPFSMGTAINFEPSTKRGEHMRNTLYFRDVSEFVLLSLMIDFIWSSRSVLKDFSEARISRFGKDTMNKEELNLLKIYAEVCFLSIVRQIQIASAPPDAKK